MSYVVYSIVGVAVVLSVSVFACTWALRARVERIPTWVCIVLLALVAYLLIAQILKLRALHMYVDISHWLQLLESIRTTGLPYVLNAHLLSPSLGIMNFFAAHVVPYIYIVAIPFALVPRAETLIIVNALVMVSAALPLFLLTRHVTGRRDVALVAAVLLLWHPTFQYATLYEFEMLRWSVPLILWMLYTFARERSGATLLLALLASLVREDVGLVIGTFGLVVVFGFRRRALGAGIAAIGFGMTAFLVSIVMPAIADTRTFQHVAAWGFAYLGGSPAGAVMALVHDPLVVLREVLHPLKLASYAMLLLPLLFLPLAAPWIAAGALGTIALGLVSANLLHSSYLLYYVTPVLPFLFAAFAYAWPRTIAWIARTRWCAGRDVVAPALAAVLTATLAVAMWFGPSPLALQFWFRGIRPAPFRTQDFHWSAYRVTAHHRAAPAFVARIPDDAIVSAQQFLHPLLFRKRGAMVYPRLATPDGAYRANYVLLDRTNNGLGPESWVTMGPEDFAIVEDHPETWELLVTDGAYALYRRRL